MSLTEEQLEIRSLARDFADQELRESGAEWDQRNALGDGVLASLSELGFLGVLVGEEHGGLGMDMTTFLVIVEELARGDASAALMMAIHNAPAATLLAAAGSESAHGAWLPRLAAGEIRGAVASWGWDRRSASEEGLPTARSTEDGWSVSGRIKAFGGIGAGLLVIPVEGVSEGEETWVLIEPSQAGVSIAADPTTMGLRAAGGASVVLDEVSVVADHVLDGGRPGDVTRALDQGRLALAAVAVGISASATEHAVDYALEREQFGRPIGSFGAIRGKLGEMRMRTEAARALVRLAAPRLDGVSVEGDASPSASAAMARMTAADAAVWVTDEAVQIFGGYGYMKDYPVEKLMRDAQGLQILGGSREALYERVVQPMLSLLTHPR